MRGVHNQIFIGLQKKAGEYRRPLEFAQLFIQASCGFLTMHAAML